MEPDGIRRYTPTLSGVDVIRCVALDSALSKHVGDALTNLVNQSEWLAYGSAVADVIEAASLTVEDYYNQMLVGSVFAWVVDPPSGWLLMDGSTRSQDDYPELFAVLPAHLKSGTNFTLPDVTAAFSYGVQDEDDATAVEGDNVLNLTVGQLPSHTHSYVPPVADVDLEAPGVPDILAARLGAPTNTGATGDGDDIDKRPLRFGLIFAVFAGR